MSGVDEFWRKAHVEQTRLWLTNSPASEVVNDLAVEQMIRPGLIVMEIGVGTGRCVRDLFERGCTVLAVDICEEALGHLDGVSYPYLASELGDVRPGSVDLAISKYFVQHIDTPDLIQHLRDVMPTLTPEGIYALETAWFDGEAGNDQESYSAELQMHGGCCRTPDCIRALAESCGAEAEGPIRSRRCLNVTLGAMHLRSKAC